MTQRPFLKLDKEFVASNFVYDKKTKKSIPLSAGYKILYVLFADRNAFWKSQNKEFFDSISSLSKMSGICERTIKRFVKDMTSLGVIYKTRKDKGNAYVVHDIFESERWKIVLEVPQESYISKRIADDPDFDCPF